MTRQELCLKFSVSESTIKTNFPTFCASQLAKGYLITKTGKGDKADYQVEKVTPEIIDKSFFSARPAQVEKEDLPNEEWVDCYIPSPYEVSNLGRVRNKNTNVLSKGSIEKHGYVDISINNKNYRLHRIIWQSFNPDKNVEDYVIDHINGIRNDNRLINLRGITDEENTAFMKINRLGLNKEITRLVNKYGYDETLKKLQAL